MNYIFGFCLCIVFILINIFYENFLKKNKIIDMKKYLYQSIMVFLAYYVLVNIVCAMIMINVFCGVIIDKYNDIKR